MVDPAVLTVGVARYSVQHLPWRQHQLSSCQGLRSGKNRHILILRGQQLDLVSSSTTEFPLEEFGVGLIDHDFAQVRVTWRPMFLHVGKFHTSHEDLSQCTEEGVGRILSLVIIQQNSGISCLRGSFCARNKQPAPLLRA